MAKILGIDIGIASIGYALIEKDDEGYTGHIITTGVRIFDRAEHPKDGSSLAVPRRTARITRRRLRRRAARLRKIKELFVQYGLITEQELEDLYGTDHDKLDPWMLRAEALKRKLEPDELARALTHIAKRRGFKSTRKSEEEKTSGELLKGVKETKNNLEAKGYKTIGEMFACDEQYQEHKRNKDGHYNHTVLRSLLQEEVKIIFENQRGFNNPYAVAAFEQHYNDIAFFQQKPIQSVKHMVGKCTFFPKESRAPKQSYSAELFVLLGKLNNTTLINPKAKQERHFSNDEIQQLVELFQNEKVTYLSIRKKLNLGQDWIFKGIEPPVQDKEEKKKKKYTTEDAVFYELKGYHKLKKAIKQYCGGDTAWNYYKSETETLNHIAQAVTYHKSDDKIEEDLKKLDLPNDLIEAAQSLAMDKVIQLSFKALEEILPFMMEGKRFDEACVLAGLNHSQPTQTTKCALLPVLSEDETTTVPVVNRAISQFRKVVNALIKKHGMFDQMNIELARDLKHSFDERKEIEKGQNAYRSQKEEVIARCQSEELNINPFEGENLLRVRLWEEQEGYCIYSGHYIKPQDIITQTQIDHIIPYGKCCDDSLNNKVLCLVSENQNKKNQIPHEYLKAEQWEDFVVRVKALHKMKPVKKNRLLKLTWTEKDTEGFKERNLNDTRYIARFVKNYVEQHLDFAHNNKKHVQVRSGSLTAFLRHHWGLEKNRDNHIHHAVDAVVIACATEGMVQRLAKVAQQWDQKDWYKHQKPSVPAPWRGKENFQQEAIQEYSKVQEEEIQKRERERFRQEVTETCNTIFVSHAPRRKATGPAHEETIRSAKYMDQGFSTVKTSLQKLDLKKLETLHDKDHNMGVYTALRDRLTQFNDDPKKAFAEPIYMPLKPEKLSKGVKPTAIKSVKLKTVTKTGVMLNNIKAVADNASMVRIDIFEKKGKYYIIPLYIADLLKEELPNKAIVSGKTENEWVPIDGTYTFKFSLYPNDLVGLQFKKNEPEILRYYVKCDRSTGSVTVKEHSKSSQERAERYGIRTAHLIKKYQVDVLGNYTEIKQEKRLGARKKVKDVVAGGTG